MGRANAMASMKTRTTPIGVTGNKRSRVKRVAHTRAKKSMKNEFPELNNHSSAIKRDALKQKLSNK